MTTHTLCGKVSNRTLEHYDACKGNFPNKYLVTQQRPLKTHRLWPIVLLQLPLTDSMNFLYACVLSRA